MFNRPAIQNALKNRMFPMLSGRMRAAAMAAAAVCCGIGIFMALPQPATAQIDYSRAYFCGATCGCTIAEHGQPNIDGLMDTENGAQAGGTTTREVIADEHDETRRHIYEEFNDWELFLIQELFMNHFLPAAMMATEQLSAVAMQQMFILGTFFDAKQQMETQRLQDRLKAEAHKDYQPSTGMCVFGTNVRSLAAAERRAEIHQTILAQRSQDRQLGHINTSAVEGAGLDKRNRLALYKERYCNIHQNGGAIGGLEELCGQSAPPETIDRDIDYSRVIDRPKTLEIDFLEEADAEPSADEIDVFALASNLFAHDVMPRVNETLFMGDNLNNQKYILDLRQLVAKRSVAENSFNAIVGMKAMGTPDPPTAGNGAPAPPPPGGNPPGNAVNTGAYMKVILQQMGLEDEEELTAYLGERPSYYAQMDILTKKMYQRPAFYTDLYDTPTNVERKKVAMQAIALMQDFDTLKSYLRQEMILSVLLEMELMQDQKLIEDDLPYLASEGPRINTD